MNFAEIILRRERRETFLNLDKMSIHALLDTVQTFDYIVVIFIYASSMLCLCLL